jgi:hypothetical protein
VKLVTSGGYGTPPNISFLHKLLYCWLPADKFLSRTNGVGVSKMQEVRTKYYPSDLSTISPPNQPLSNLNGALLFLSIAQAEFSSNSGYWCDIEIMKYLLTQTRDQIKAEYDKVAKLV